MIEEQGTTPDKNQESDVDAGILIKEDRDVEV